MAQKVVLTILDGVGYTTKTEYNAVEKAPASNYERLRNENLWCYLKTSGEDVGLPEGQMGNSEVGHMNIGAGRVVFQDLGRIHFAIKSGEFAKKSELAESVEALKKSGGSMHIMGLASTGGVHSHILHMIASAKFFAEQGIDVKIHAFADGRDVAPSTIKDFLKQLLDLSKDYKNISVVTVCGRYYAMDRDNRWERIGLAYNAIVNGSAEITTNNLVQKVQESLDSGVTDEFFKPIVLEGYTGIKDGDGIFCINFRADRVREILNAIIMPDFKEFSVKKLALVSKLGMSNYSTQLDANMQILFRSEDIVKTVGEVISNAGKTQFRTAETEKYPHVTFFFNGGREELFKGEDRQVIPSPKVATYDLKPEMSAYEVCDLVVNAIKSDKYDFIVVNFANGDMVGHTGSFEAAKKAVLAVEKCLENIEAEIKKHGSKYTWLVTADHGNCEEMWDYENNIPHTQHTTNPVWLAVVNVPKEYTKLNNGRLADIAPTVLKLMGIEQPKEMSGKNLLEK